MNYITSFPFLITMIAELVAAIFALIYYYKYKNSSLKLLAFYLVYMVISEFSAWFYVYYYRFLNQQQNVNNLVLFNIYSIVTAYVFLYIYFKSIHSKIGKVIVVAMGIFYGIISLANCFYHSFIYEMTDLPDIVLSFIIVISVIIYLYEILNSDKIIIINKLLLFWVSIALLMYYLPIVPFQVVAKFYRYGKAVPQFYLINSILAGIYYTIFILGFIWSGKNQKD